MKRVITIGLAAISFFGCSGGLQTLKDTARLTVKKVHLPEAETNIYLSDPWKEKPDGLYVDVSLSGLPEGDLVRIFVLNEARIERRFDPYTRRLMRIISNQTIREIQWVDASGRVCNVFYAGKKRHAKGMIAPWSDHAKLVALLVVHYRRCANCPGGFEPIRFCEYKNVPLAADMWAKWSPTIAPNEKTIAWYPLEKLPWNIQGEIAPRQ